MVCGSVVDFVLSAQTFRELVTDEVGKYLDLPCVPLSSQWTPQQPSHRESHKVPQHTALLLSVLATDLENRPRLDAYFVQMAS